MAYRALASIRVLDLGIITAGAGTSAILADMGAEVIKIEGPSYLDPFRDWQGDRGEGWWEQSANFRATNRNKKSLCLDLKSAKGRELFLDLVAASDVVVENFRVGVLDKLGIGFESLRTANPRIVLASLSSQGAAGPLARNVSFGSTLEATSGMAHLMRYPDGGPKITGRIFNYPDQVVSLFAAGAIMAALAERLRTDRGVWIDLSQRELAAFLIGDAYAAAFDGSLPPVYPIGAGAAMQMLARTSDGQWLAVTVPFTAAREVEAQLGLTTENALQQWVGFHAAIEAARTLRSVGAAAEIVLAAKNYQDDDPVPPGNALGRDTAGYEVKGQPIRLGGHDDGDPREVPRLGHHNREIATTLLGLSAAQYEALFAEGIFADRPAIPAAG